MMKKVLFALAVLCTSFWSCNTLDLNDVGYGDCLLYTSDAADEL